MEDHHKLVSKDDITNLNLRKWSSMGLKPYIFNDNEESEDFGMIPVTEIPEKGEFNFKREIFLLSDSEIMNLQRMIDNTKNLVSLYKRKIELIKDYIRSIAIEGDNN